MPRYLFRVGLQVVYEVRMDFVIKQGIALVEALLTDTVRLVKGSSFLFYNDGHTYPGLIFQVDAESVEAADQFRRSIIDSAHINHIVNLIFDNMVRIVDEQPVKPIRQNATA